MLEPGQIRISEGLRREHRCRHSVDQRRIEHLLGEVEVDLVELGRTRGAADPRQRRAQQPFDAAKLAQPHGIVGLGAQPEDVVIGIVVEGHVAQPPQPAIAANAFGHLCHVRLDAGLGRMIQPDQHCLAETRHADLPSCLLVPPILGRRRARRRRLGKFCRVKARHIFALIEAGMWLDFVLLE